MTNFRDLAKKVLAGEEVTLDVKRYNDGTKEKPDILINRVYMIVESFRDGQFKDIVTYLSKEDDECILETHECHRLPYIQDLDVLEKLLKMSKDQSRCREMDY